MELFNLRQTAEMLGVGYTYLWQSIKDGHVPEPKTIIGSRRLFSMEEIEAARMILALKKEVNKKYKKCNYIKK